MSYSALPVNTETFWNFDPATPHPTQDTALLAQLHFIPGLKELLMLRQVHALEHGTVWMLGEIANPGTSQKLLDNESLGGLSTDRGFYLYGPVPKIQLVRAVRLALERFKQGEWDLAVHPRCGTNLSVAVALTTGLALGTSWLLPRGPIAQLAGLGLAATMASQLSPDLGSWVQRHLTTAVPFNLEINDIYPTTDLWGRSAYFVAVSWQENR
ncbi:MAG: DUF6391 domain-containing protein [Spirulinaceae cyanobacterium]